MRNFFYKSKIIIPILSISIIYNLLWFTLFIYLILDFSEYRFSITIGFLVFYMAIAEPLKDFFLHLVFFKPLYPAVEKKSVEDHRIKELTKKSQIGKLMKILLKELNIPRITMVVKNSVYKQTDYYKDSNAAERKFEQEDLNHIFNHLKEIIDNALPVIIPEEIGKIKKKYNCGEIIPIAYKSRFFGFLAIYSHLDIRKNTVFESLASRIALLLENDLLTESALKNETFKRELSVARKIEKFLVEHKTLQVGQYSVLFNHNIKSTDDAPVLFDNSISSDCNFFIYCKISRANKKKRTMMLFIISGYFLTFSKECTDLKKLAGNLSRAIFENGKEFGIEGFLLEHKKDLSWKVCYFGNTIHAHGDGKEIKLKECNPLGSDAKSNCKLIELKNKKEINFRIYQHSEVLIKKNEK